MRELQLGGGNGALRSIFWGALWRSAHLALWERRRERLCPVRRCGARMATLVRCNKRIIYKALRCAVLE